MHEGVWSTVLGLFGLITIAVLILPLSRKIKIPYTVLLALVGIILGLLNLVLGDSNFGIISHLFQGFKSFGLTSEVIFFVFLPALIFEASLAIDVRKLISDIRPILFLAIIGLLISTFMIGGTIHLFTGVGFVVCLLLGAILSATDPVAVVAIFKDLGAPKRLAILVEGESLFNDATAIVLFTILVAIITGKADPNLAEGTLQFLKVFLGGIVVGYIMARVFAWVISLVNGIVLVEVTLTISLAYLSFLVAEHYLHVSGVMAVVTAALVIGSYGRTSVSGAGWHALEETWENIGFWANSLIFVLVGLAVPEIMSAFSASMWTTLLLVLVIAFVARGLLTHAILPLLSSTKLFPKVNLGFRTVMWWGGLRGAVSLALALAVFENENIAMDDRNFIVALVCAFVLFTLFINATTVAAVMKAFGLDKLSASDLVVRDRTIERALRDVAGGVPEISINNTISNEISEEIVKEYESRVEQLVQSSKNKRSLTHNEWIKFGLLSIIGQERKLYFDDYSKGYVDPGIARELVSTTDDMLDSVKSDGVPGYSEVFKRLLDFNWRGRFAMRVQRRLGIVTPLRNYLSNRIASLQAILAVLSRIRYNGITEIESLIGSENADDLRNIIDERREVTQAALNALQAQYPDYVSAIQNLNLRQIALKQEQQKYHDLYSDSIINTEIFVNLDAELTRKEEALSQRPQLDLGLDPITLLGRVPLFESISADKIRTIAALLKPELVIPEEVLCTRGEPGDSMYFISSGAVAVETDTQTIMLGSGDFFGEIALLKESPRTATVIAESFCDLLILKRSEFVTLLEANPTLKEEIEGVAQERIGASDC